MDPFKPQIELSRQVASRFLLEPQGNGFDSPCRPNLHSWTSPSSIELSFGFCNIQFFERGSFSAAVTAARLTPDQKVGSSNLSARILRATFTSLQAHLRDHFQFPGPFQSQPSCPLSCPFSGPHPSPRQAHFQAHFQAHLQAQLWAHLQTRRRARFQAHIQAHFEPNLQAHLQEHTFVCFPK